MSLDEAYALAERKPATHHSLLATVVQQGYDAVVFTDSNGRIMYVNPAFERITGLSSSNVVGRAASDLARSFSASQIIRDIWTSLRSGQTWHGTVVAARANGPRHHVDTVVFPVHPPHLDEVRYVAIGRDVTDTIVLREQLRHAEKMQSLGQFAAGIAHDFKNLLAVIEASAARLRTRCFPDLTNGPHDDIAAITRSVEAGVQLCRSLLGFSRERPGPTELLELNDVVSGTIPLLKRLLPATIELHVRLAPEGCLAECTVVEIQQILLNLCSNAKDAMPRGGTLSITTVSMELGDEFTRDRSWARAGRYVAIKIQDTGVGMDPATRDKVLSPFFTTKDPEKGTGLGLSSVYGIAKKHGGMIDIDSVQGCGTTVTVYFPAVSPPASSPASASSSRPGSLAGSAIVAEDQPEMRSLLGVLLRGLGLEVFEAPDGMAASEMARHLGASLSLLVSDATMPGIRGLELYRRIRESNPRVPFLLCTGDPQATRGEERAIADPLFSFIEKPFDIHRFETVVRDLLQRQGSTDEPAAAEAVERTGEDDCRGDR
ncbi:MAG TPA: PAS domain S-box protein [Acidobacteria bacterium]|nr:PAS domain S-box protein [Acidobacteriota bacterium]